jgi:hypothetical protein
MSNDIQPGDTVKIINGPGGFYYHPTERRYLQEGDRVVVTKITNGLIYYLNFINREEGLYCWRVQKITTNHVEIKFR